MRRGFKAEAERIAGRILTQLGNPPTRPADIRALAQHLHVEVISAAELVDVTELEELERLQPGAFSAATFRMPGNRVVAVYNPLNERGRTNSDLAHELAHLLLNHDVRELQTIAGRTFFTCDPEQEQEANWLAGSLLLPRPLLLREAMNGATADRLADRYSVTPAMARFRLNTSGVLLQAQRADARRSGQRRLG